MAWCLSRVPSSYYGATWRLYVPRPPAEAPAEHLLCKGPPDEALAEAPAEQPDDALVQALEEQRRVPWGGKKIDWAPPEIGFIVGVETPTSYWGGF